MFHPHLKQYFFKYKKHLIIGTVSTFFSTLLNLAPAYFIKNIVDSLQDNTLTAPVLLVQLFGWLVCFALSGYTLFSQRMWVVSASRHIEHDLRLDFYTSLQQQPRSFFDQYSSGDLVSAFTNDLERIRELMGPSILHGARGLFLILSTIAYMFWLSFELTAYIIIPLLAVPILTPLIMIYMGKLYTQIQQALSDLTQITQEILSGITIIKDYTAEDTFIKRFINKADLIKKTTIRVTNVTALEWPFLEFVAGLGLIILLYTGGMKVMQKELQIGELVALMMLVFRIRMPLIITGWVISMIQRGRSAMKRFYKIFDTMEAFKLFIQEQSKKPDTTVETIDIVDLNFAYKNQIPVLKNINLHWEKGQTIGIVGPVGSGKSTLALLVAGIYQDHQGQILINGKQAKETPFAERIRLFAWVPQDNFLFSSSIKENILFGQSGTNQDYEKYGEIAGLKPDITGFPEGYESLLGERGINLSGGQKQRVSIARGLIADAPVLIFDDSFSSLDAQTESILLQNLSQMRKDKINIIISHRLSTLQAADIIYVIEEGEITEQGDHAALMEKDGYYAKTYKEQQTALEITA